MPETINLINEIELPDQALLDEAIRLDKELSESLGRLPTKEERFECLALPETSPLHVAVGFWDKGEVRDLQIRRCELILAQARIRVADAQRKPKRSSTEGQELYETLTEQVLAEAARHREYLRRWKKAKNPVVNLLYERASRALEEAQALADEESVASVT